MPRSLPLPPQSIQYMVYLPVPYLTSAFVTHVHPTVLGFGERHPGNNGIISGK